MDAVPEGPRYWGGNAEPQQRRLACIRIVVYVFLIIQSIDALESAAWRARFVRFVRAFKGNLFASGAWVSCVCAYEIRFGRAASLALDAHRPRQTRAHI